MPDYYYLVLVDDDGLAPAVGFDRGSDFGDRPGAPLARVLRVVFGTIDVPHFDLHSQCHVTFMVDYRGLSSDCKTL